MQGEPTILSARRSYTFPVDAIPLAMLITPRVQEQIKASFNFSTASMGITMQPGTTVTISPNMPAGVVFQWGTASGADGSFIAIRLLQIESGRILIDVVGPSDSVTGIYEQLRGLIGATFGSGKTLPEEPLEVKDYSEVVVHLDFDIERLLSEPVQAFAKRVLAATEGQAIVPSYIIQRMDAEAEYGGAGGTDQYVLQVRAGSRLSDRSFFSSAPLATTDHLAYLSDLEAVLST